MHFGIKGNLLFSNINNAFDHIAKVMSLQF